MTQASPTGGNPAAPPGRDVLCLSSIDWSDNWQVHQQLARALAARGDRVAHPFQRENEERSGDQVDQLDKLIDHLARP